MKRIPRASRAVHHHSLDKLESRLHLSTSAMGGCGCAACQAIRNAAGGAADRQTTITQLLDINALPKKAAIAAAAAGGALWDGVASVGTRAAGVLMNVHASKFTPFELDFQSLQQTLSRAPLEDTRAASSGALSLAIPNPDGSYSRFKIVESPIMEPKLAAQFPSIKTYGGVGLDDPSATIRLDQTPAGFHAQVLSSKGAWYVDPYWHLDQSVYASYYKRDAYSTHMWQCLTPSVPVDPSKPTGPGSGGPEVANGTQRREYRAAVAATGEYTAFHGGTVTLGQAAIVTAMNRVNQVYETDLAVRMTLVANNSSLVYTNAATDPYTNNDGFAMLSQNQSNIDTIIGNANYDIGHVFSTNGGGVAGLGVIRVTGQKAQGVTGTSTPINDPFTIDYVAHEMGHQFGGNHTFNSTTSSCGGGNRNASTAYEPGSGSTIMAYAGICASDDLQPNSDPMFLWKSQDEIVATMISRGANAMVNTGNTVPTVNAGADFTIPQGTPFTLTGSATDPNGVLSYSWEQADLGAATTLAVADNGFSPLFRPFNPVANPSRTFPRLSKILSNSAANDGEKLPTTNRTMHFNLSVRDNFAGSGGINYDQANVTSTTTAGPFLVTAPNTAVTWAGNSAQNVTWNVAGTNAGSVNTANVRISLSTDGGLTYPTVLLASTPNDGAHSITVPNVATTTARIKVEAVGNIYFDLSNFNFTITFTATPNGIWDGGGDGINWNDPINWSNNVLPGAADDCVLNVVANPGVTVFGSHSVRSVTSSEFLDVYGTLSVSQASTFNDLVQLNVNGNLAGAGNMTFNNVVNWGNGTMAGPGSSTVSATGTLNVQSAGITQSTRPLIIAGNANLSSGGNKTLLLSSLSFTGTGKLDLRDNDLILDYTGGSQLATIQTFINTARNGGAWDGNGLTSTTAASIPNDNTTLGAMEATDYDSVYGAGALFNTFDPDATSVLVKYTYYGDVDFNGLVDFDDYVKTDNGFNSGLSGWLNGDSNGDGSVDFDDYVNIDNSFNTQSGVL